MSRLTLSEIATVNTGKQLNRNTLTDNDKYPVYNGGVDISGTYRQFNTSADTIIISQGGESAGYVNFITEPFWAGAHCYVINPLLGTINKKYLYYYLKAMQPELQKARSGSSIPGLNKSRLLQFPIQIPTPNSQNNIAHTLSLFDNKIDLNNKINSQIEEIIDLIYNYWFVQFDFPDENGRPYKSSGGKMVYSPELDCDIPEGWTISSLANTKLAELIKPGINPFTDNKFYLATADVNNNQISNNPDTISYNERPGRANMQPTEYSAWFAKMKDSPKHIFVSKHSIDLIDKHVFSTGFTGLQATDTSYPYIASFISQTGFEDRKDALAHGATMKSVSNADLNKIYIAEPTEQVLFKYSKLITPILELIDSNRRESKQLASLRDWLLPMLMNGQVVIK